MTGETITLKPTAEPEICFQGLVVARAEGSPQLLDQIGRRHIVTVFQCVDGRFCTQIEFISHCPGEKPHTAVQSRLLFEDIDAVLMVYDPTEYLNRSQLQQETKGVSSQVQKSLWEQFDMLAVEIQKQMSGFEDTSPPSAEQEKSGSSRWSQWLPFSGPRD